MEQLEQRQMVISVIETQQKDSEGWVDLAIVGASLVNAGINYKQFGYSKLRLFLNTFNDCLEFKEQKDTEKPPVYYVKLKNNECIEESIQSSVDLSLSKSENLYLGNSYRKKEKKIPTKDSWLYNWASINRDKSKELCELALPEKWYYGNTPPTGQDQYPILSNYLAYTFKKLCAEQKVLIQKDTKTNKEYAAFNTGLVDKKYEYIYALFKQNTKSKDRYWYLVEFAVAGEETAGKTLVSLFNPLPSKANYFGNNIANMLYDTTTGKLSSDYNHILTERNDRFPIEFFKDNCPEEFTCIDGIDIESVHNENEDTQKEYYKKLGQKTIENTQILNRLKNRLDESVNKALKRVEWNYKTAIPVYFPKNDTMSLLLPLALMDEETVDLALVVERQQSGAYQGQTVLPLKMAYNNSRLVTRPDSDWLKTEKIIATSDIDDEEDL